MSVRYLILPADPEAALLRFDDEFWAWWRPEREAPFPGRVSWGHAFHPTGDAAVRHDEVSDDRWAWDRYCALHRSGAFEFALGEAATHELRGTVVFRLIEIVGRVWAAVNLYGEALDRTEVEGPWQSVLALRGTEGAHLGNLAQGWASPGEGYDLATCPEPNLLFVRELTAWPRDEQAKDFVFELGSAVDEAWGSERPRFIATRGPTAGDFDWQMFRDTP